MELRLVANRIVSSGPHEPPRESTAPSATTCTAPPPPGIFFKFPSAKKPAQRPSGDQNGSWAFSVPGKGRAATSSMGRSQSSGLDPAAEATNTRFRPSGERENCGTGIVAETAPDQVVPCGG